MKHIRPTLLVVNLCLLVCLSAHPTFAQTTPKQPTDKQAAATSPSDEKPQEKSHEKSQTKGPVTNLLLNGSMEYWHPSGLRAQGWGVWTPDSLRQSWNVKRNHKIVSDGKSSMEVNTTTWANAFSGAKVEAGKTYTFSIYVRVDKVRVDKVPADKPVQLTLTQHVGGKDVEGPQKAAKRANQIYDLKPGQWQRVSVTDTMPPGATSVTCYLLLRGQAQWFFDKGMLNEGELADYVVGEHYQPITPIGRVKQPGETTFVPAYWNADNQEVDDQEVAFCFDSDIMSFYRFCQNNAAIGGRFEQPVRLRGLTLLLHETPLPDDVTISLQIQRDDQWQDYDFKPVAVGTSTLLSFEPIDMQAFRVKFSFIEKSHDKTAEGKKTLRQLLRVYHIGLAQ